MPQGGRIFAQERGARDGRWFEGHIHFVRKAEVGLRFHGSFGRYSESAIFHIRFRLNRIPRTPSLTKPWILRSTRSGFRFQRKITYLRSESPVRQRVLQLDVIILCYRTTPLSFRP